MTQWPDERPYMTRLGVNMWLRDTCFITEQTEACTGDQDTCVWIATNQLSENCFYFPDASCPKSRMRDGVAMVSLVANIHQVDFTWSERDMSHSWSRLAKRSRNSSLCLSRTSKHSLLKDEELYFKSTGPLEVLVWSLWSPKSPGNLWTCDKNSF